MTSEGTASQASGATLPVQQDLGTADVERTAEAQKSTSIAPDPDIVDFDGPNDQDNPMNWSSSKKAAAIGMVTLMTLFSYASQSILCPTNGNESKMMLT